MWVRSQGQVWSLEEEMVTHISVLTWKIAWTEEPGRLESMDHKELDMTEWLQFSFYWLEGQMVKLKHQLFWPPNMKKQLIRKDPNVGKDWRQEAKGSTEGEMVGWHHQQRMWVWANSRRQWRTGKPGVSSSWYHRIRDILVSEQQQQIIQNFLST